MRITKNNNTSILFVPFGSPEVPAAWYRLYKYLPYLSSKDMRYRIFPSISKWTARQMIRSPNFTKIKRYMYYFLVILEKIIRFPSILFLSTRYDVIFLQRATFPFGLERLLKLVNRNIIFDIDDAIYMPDREEGGFIARIKKYIKRQEVVSIMRLSKCIIVTTKALKKFAERYCNNVCIIVASIDTVRNFIKEDRPNPEEFTIGWIGSPATTSYLKSMDRILQNLNKKYKIKVRIIGASSYSLDGVKIEHVDWDRKTEVSELHKFDIGIMPMPDNEWTRGKIGVKMLQYMGNAIPLVVSYTPTTVEVIEDGVNGFLASSEEEWIEKISNLIEDPELRRKTGLLGRKTVEERYSLKVNAPIFFEILKNLHG